MNVKKEKKVKESKEEYKEKREKNKEKHREEKSGKWGKTSAGKGYTDRVDSKLKGDSRKEVMWNSTLLFENLTWLTSNEAAQYLRLPSVGALRVLVCKRRLPFHKLGRSLRFKKAELDRLLEASRNGGI